MDLDAWLEPVPGDKPAGPNLEYDAAFLELEEAARVQPDQEFGTDNGAGVRRIEGSGPDWPTVRKLAESLLTRTKDIRVAMYLTRAMVRTEGLAGLERGALLLHGLLDRFWDGIHPELDADDYNDPTMRINALAPMVAADALLGDLREAWVVRSRQAGVLSVRDIEVLAGKLPARADTAPMTEAQVQGMLAAAFGEDPDLAQRPRRVSDAVRAIEALVADKVGASQGIDLKPLLSALYPVMQAVERAAPAPVAEPAGSGEGAEGGMPSATAVMPAGRPGEIRSREDVVTQLEQICAYLARSEPTNPVQLLLRRAQRMMHMSFLELINDLAPDGLTQAERVVGAKFESGE